MVHFCLAAVYPLPQPGPSATKGPVVMTEQSATLTMDTTYQQESPYLQVCSLTTNICCHCQGTDVSNCKFGKLSSSTDNGGDYTSCQLTTSKPDQYQFQVYTYNYPCFYDIGDPIEVDDDNSNSSEFDFRMLSYSLGGVSVLLVLGIIGTFCVTRKVYKGRYVQLGMLILICQIVQTLVVENFSRFGDSTNPLKLLSANNFLSRVRIINAHH